MSKNKKNRQSFKQAYYNFMYGRYGGDQLNLFLICLSIALAVPYYILRTSLYSFIFIAVMIILLTLSILRMFSRKTEARRKENEVFLNIVTYIPHKISFGIRKFKERKEFRYVKCPSCKAQLRLRRPPKGKKIEITCRKCGNKFIKKF